MTHYELLELMNAVHIGSPSARHLVIGTPRHSGKSYAERALREMQAEVFGREPRPMGLYSYIDEAVDLEQVQPCNRTYLLPIAFRTVSEHIIGVYNESR